MKSAGFKPNYLRYRPVDFLLLTIDIIIRLQVAHVQANFIPTSSPAEQLVSFDSNEISLSEKLVLSYIHSSFDERIKLADIDPLEPTAKVGDNFTLTCTLTEEGQRQLNSSLMYFAAKRHNENKTSPLSRDLQMIVDRRTLRLQITNIQLSDRGEYSCHVISHMVPSLSQFQSHDAIRETYVIVREPLILPAISCISDNMLDMTCSWCGTELTTGVGQQANDAIEDTETRWIIYWQKEGDDFFHNVTHSGDDWVFKRGNCMMYFCGLVKTEQCDLGHPRYESAFIADKLYSINVTILTPWGNAHSAVTVFTNESVGRPGLVEEVKGEVLNDSTVQLSWKQPKYFPNRYSLVYLVTYRIIDNSKQIKFNNSKQYQQDSTTTAVVLNGLLPDTEYQICVRGRLKHGLLLSDCANTTLHTDVAIPGHVEETSIVIEYVNGSTTMNIRISWDKPNMPNGQIDFYHLIARVNGKMTANETLTETTSFITAWCGTDHVMIEVAINAVNRGRKNVLMIGRITTASRQIQCADGKESKNVTIVTIACAIVLASLLASVSIWRAMKEIRKRLSFNVPCYTASEQQTQDETEMLNRARNEEENAVYIENNVPLIESIINDGNNSHYCNVTNSINNFNQGDNTEGTVNNNTNVDEIIDYCAIAPVDESIGNKNDGTNVKNNNENDNQNDSCENENMSKEHYEFEHPNCNKTNRLLNSEKNDNNRNQHNNFTNSIDSFNQVDSNESNVDKKTSIIDIKDCFCTIAQENEDNNDSSNETRNENNDKVNDDSNSTNSVYGSDNIENNFDNTNINDYTKKSNNTLDKTNINNDDKNVMRNSLYDNECTSNENSELERHDYDENKKLIMSANTDDNNCHHCADTNSINSFNQDDDNEDNIDNNTSMNKINFGYCTAAQENKDDNNISNSK